MQHCLWWFICTSRHKNKIKLVNYRSVVITRIICLCLWDIFYRVRAVPSTLFIYLSVHCIFSEQILSVTFIYLSNQYILFPVRRYSTVSSKHLCDCSKHMNVCGCIRTVRGLIADLLYEELKSSGVFHQGTVKTP